MVARLIFIVAFVLIFCNHFSNSSHVITSFKEDSQLIFAHVVSYLVYRFNVVVFGIDKIHCACNFKRCIVMVKGM